MEKKEYYLIKPYNDALPKPPKENFSEILSEAYLHPFDWKARTTRKSYWISALVNFIISILTAVIIYYGIISENLGLKWIDFVISAVLLIWIWLASLGQTIRRLHDVNYSGYWYWASIVPYGNLFLFYLSIQPSVQHATRWGDYLYSEKNIYGTYTKELDRSNVPIPTIGQILKEHFFDCFKWNARSTRTSYWVGTAISSIVCMILIFPVYFLSFMIYFSSLNDSSLDALGPVMIFLVIIMIVGVIWVLLAQLGHTIRRLHDAGLSGWWFLICIIPYIGDPILALLLFHPTVEHEVEWNGYLFEEKDNVVK